ncbi:gamma-glutamyltranspeptidase, partial [Globomyces pollinis-pini]
AVATENVICTNVGLDILEKGGSAADSAIAATICLGTVNFYASGIGGGGFLVMRDRSGESTYINFREEAPAASYQNMFKDDPMKAQEGGMSIGVPGELRGLELAYQRSGKLPWKTLIEPSIQLAEQGWAINKVFASKIASNEKYILADPTLSSVLAPNGVILKENEWITRPTFAKTLTVLANEGVEPFYTGWIAEELVKTIRARGGIMTMEDMKSYVAKEESPIMGTFRGYDIMTAPPPASGSVFIAILNILENFPPLDLKNPTDMHRLVEAFKHGFAVRGYLGDPIDPIFQNISSIALKFMQKEFAQSIIPLIHDNRTYPPEYYEPSFDVLTDHGTMHVSVLTETGESVALTSTVNLIFGSKVMDPTTGIMLNDQMDDFSIPGVSNAFGLAPSPYNFVQPRKRPLSSSVPTIIQKDGSVVAVLGASGGSHISTSTLQVLVRMLDMNMDADDAVSSPRIHHQLLPNKVNH